MAEAKIPTVKTEEIDEIESFALLYVGGKNSDYKGPNDPHRQIIMRLASDALKLTRLARAATCHSCTKHFVVRQHNTPRYLCDGCAVIEAKAGKSVIRPGHEAPSEPQTAPSPAVDMGE